MLMALLYSEEDRIVAAAPACDQTSYGYDYWDQIHEGDFIVQPEYDTAYVHVEDEDLQQRLLLVGIDQLVDGAQLAIEVAELSVIRRAA